MRKKLGLIDIVNIITTDMENGELVVLDITKRNMKGYVKNTSICVLLIMRVIKRLLPN